MYLKRWQRDPMFYVDQTLTPVAEALTVPGPYDEAQSREILARLNNIPAIAEQARANLTSPSAELARMAIDSLGWREGEVGDDGEVACAGDEGAARRNCRRRRSAQGVALEGYRAWLQGSLPRVSGTVGGGARELCVVPAKRCADAVYAGGIGIARGTGVASCGGV